MLYLFLLGRDPELSKLEIESVFERLKIKFQIIESGKHVAVVDCDKLNPRIINEFGGIINIAEVISSSDRLDQIEEALNKADIYNGTSNKIEYFIDHFSTDLTSFLEDYLKDYFKSIKVKALYKKQGEPSRIFEKLQLGKTLNFVVFKSYIGKVFSITNPKEFKMRDDVRPNVDFLKVISIRLAKILVNLSKAKENQILLDPFCGSGTILQEAMLKGIKVIGVDNDKEAMKQSKDNLEWLKGTYKLNVDFKLIEANVIDLAKEIKKVDAVVTEPYMGPYIRKLPNVLEGRKLVIELSNLYNDLMKNLKDIIKTNGRLVIIIPTIRTRENKKLFINFNDIIEKNGFNLINNPIEYNYRKSKILRQIYVLERL
ncbi:methyltransferase domain-containing protein [Candidatus Woesearchaeota archaeon]|nr:methyltransferase domain-containing protein [Candidatus Woesearchaeota archaeon]